MGQAISVRETTIVGDVALFDTDRSITGQDGSAYGSGEQAVQDGTFPAKLAAELFETDPSIDHVFIASNQVVARRRGGWVQAVAARAGSVIEDFFLFYDEQGGS